MCIVLSAVHMNQNSSPMQSHLKCMLHCGFMFNKLIKGCCTLCCVASSLDILYSICWLAFGTTSAHMEYPNIGRDKREALQLSPQT